jgi:Flp pilus assembly protein TadB
MKKKNLIILIAIIILVIIFLFYSHYMPIWVNLQNIVVFAVGVIVGVLGLYTYNKYFKKVEDTDEPK